MIDSPLKLTGEHTRNIFISPNESRRPARPAFPAWSADHRLYPLPGQRGGEESVAVLGGDVVPQEAVAASREPSSMGIQMGPGPCGHQMWIHVQQPLLVKGTRDPVRAFWWLNPLFLVDLKHGSHMSGQNVPLHLLKDVCRHVDRTSNCGSRIQLPSNPTLAKTRKTRIPGRLF